MIVEGDLPANLDLSGSFMCIHGLVGGNVDGAVKGSVNKSECEAKISCTNPSLNRSKPDFLLLTVRGFVVL